MTTETTKPLDVQLLEDFDVLDSVPAFKEFDNDIHRVLRRDHHLTFKEAVAVQTDCLKWGAATQRAFREYEEAFKMGVTLAEIEQFRIEHGKSVFNLVHYRKVATMSETLEFLKRFDGIEHNHYVLLRKRGATHDDAMDAHGIGMRFTEKYAACLNVVAHNEPWASGVGLTPSVVLLLMKDRDEFEQEEIRALLYSGSLDESTENSEALRRRIAALPA